MRSRRFIVTCLTVILIAGLVEVSAGERPQPTGALSLTPCEIDGVAGTTLCGSYSIREGTGSSRTIHLNIAVLKATGAAPQPDPIVPLQGGPGQGAVDLAAFYAGTMAPLRRSRDIILIDVRGTGRSNPLICDIASPDSLMSVDLLPPAAIAACRTTLEARADLRRYTTRSIVSDLDEVRGAMGVRQWNLYGTSYGTRLAQEYMRLYGARVRTATLKGIVPPSVAIPLPYARNAQAAFDRSVDDATRTSFLQVLERLRREPVIATADGRQLTISAGLFAEVVRNLLYNPASVDTMVRMIGTAAHGDFSAAADSILRLRRSFSSDIALGMFLSVTCGEDIPRIESAMVADAVRGTFLGDYRIRQQQGACRLWRAAARSADQAIAVVSDVPALLLSGDVDPVTPPRFGEEVVKTLRKGRHVILKGNGHPIGTAAPCVTSLMERFVAGATAEHLDVTCVSESK